MNNDRGDADLLEFARAMRRRMIRVVPTETHFAGDRNFDGVDHCLDHAGGLGVIGH